MSLLEPRPGNPGLAQPGEARSGLVETGLRGLDEGASGAWRPALLTFFVLLWWLGCFYLHGDLGRYSDDWSLAIIDPITREPVWGSWPFERSYFWRPLLQLYLHYMLQVLWHSMWIFHLCNVLWHGATAVLVYVLSRRLTGSRQGAAAAGLLFLLFPFQYEVIFWSTAMTTGIPTGLWLLLALWFTRFARGGGGGAWGVAGAGVFTFGIACWYEQPGALVGSFPFLYMALRKAGEPLGRSALRLAGLLAACGAGLLIYILLLRATAPASVRGGAQSFVTLSEAPARFKEMWVGLTFSYTSRLADAFIGGLLAGWARLGSAWGMAAVGTVAVAGGLLLQVWMRERPARGPGHETRTGWLLAFAVSAIVCAWIPVLLIRGQIVEPRMMYAASVGLCIGVAVLLGMLLRASEGWRFGGLVRGSTGVLVVLGAWMGAVSLVGWQSSMQARTRADAAQTQQLANLYADVPPGTVFVAVRDDFRAGKTGRGFFDLVLLSWVATSWTTTPALQQAFGRDDVFATTSNHWVAPPFADVTEHGLRFTTGLPAAAGKADPAGGIWLEWARVIPYAISAEGKVVPVHTLMITQKGRAEFEVQGHRGLAGKEGQEGVDVARLELPAAAGDTK